MMIDPAYMEGLAADGLARFVDSQGKVWLIPVKDVNGGTDGGRYLVDLVDMYSSYADPSAYYPDQYDKVLDEYLFSSKNQ